ncbi:MAG: hypothetical protein M1812_007245 [Candelaria pacifica]|nr:MAG: hypothetical protein M1812_007245 [Candelaria pacifica]
MSQFKRGLLFVSIYLVRSIAAVEINAPKTISTNAASCPCGYYDDETKNLFTESIVVYFNETTALPIDGFTTESYRNDYEKGFTSLYRQGANPSNVRFGNYSSFPSLELLVSPTTPDHVVIGGAIRTSRRDIQYGSFRSLLRSPPQYPGGSALSMHLEYNQTESIDMNLMNTDDPANAWIGMQVHQTVDRELGANYSSLANNISSPWNYTEYRIDWTADEIVYYVGGIKHRVVSRKEDGKLPSVPAPFYLKHWSVGDPQTTEGPPAALSIANVGWVRMFFNSSTMMEDGHAKFDSRCQRQTVCGMDDTSLRASSQFSPEAELWWEQAPTKKGKRVPAIVIAALCIALSSFLVLNALSKRVPWEKISWKKGKLVVQKRTQLSEEEEIQVTEGEKKEAQPPEPLPWDSVADNSKPAFTNPFMGGGPLPEPELTNGSASTFSSGWSAVDTIASYDDSSGRLRPNTMVTQDPRADALAALEGSMSPAFEPRDSSSVSIVSALKDGPQAEIVKPRGSSSVDFALMDSSGEKLMQKGENGSASSQTWVNPFEVRNSGTFTHKSSNTPSRAAVLDNNHKSSLSTALENTSDAVVNRRASGSISPFGFTHVLAEGSAKELDIDRVSPSLPKRSADSTTGKRLSGSLSPGFADTPAEPKTRKRNRGSIPNALEVVNEELAVKKPDRSSNVSIEEPKTPPTDETDLPCHPNTISNRHISAFSEGLATPFTPTPERHIGLPPIKERIDYLAGLLAFSSLIITVINFCYTFSPALVSSDAQAHYPSEVWTRKMIAPYLMNSAWFGPFLLISSRFLVSNYLRNGDLLRIAEKTVGRTFRLMVPIVGIALLEYFLMDSGAVKWLEFLPSITFSTWPFVAVPDNLGHFISAMLSLLYIIPNALPQLINNYCTNVLWTIPVQLQGSWTVLLCAIVIREIKTPWKRFGYYTFCIVNHWYALSWGSYFYFGVLLADLEITYKYRKWLYPRPTVYYPVVILCAILAIGGLSSDLATQWTGNNNVQLEYGIHPDNITGLPIAQTSNPQTSPFFVPRLNSLIFAVGAQGVIELSSLTQRVFSAKPLTWLSRHTYTIYLMHGFIFWSLGSWLCIAIAVRGWPYWLNILLVAITCYSVLFLSLPALTPIVDVLGKKSARHLWYFAYEQPAPRRATLFPFPQDMLYLEHNVVSGDNRSSTRKGSIMHRRGTYDLDEPEQSNARSDRRVSIMHRRGTYDLDEASQQTPISNRRISIMHRRGTPDLEDPSHQSTTPNRRPSIKHNRSTFEMQEPPSTNEPPNTTSEPPNPSNPHPSLLNRRANAPSLSNIDTQRSEDYRNNRHISIYEPEETSSSTAAAARRISIYDRRTTLSSHGSHGSPEQAGNSSAAPPMSGVSPRTRTRNFSRVLGREDSEEGGGGDGDDMV